MIFKKLIPQERLRPYISCYWLMDSQGEVTVNDRLLPNGYTEIVFNLGSATWESSVADKFYINPSIELLGQRTQPSLIKSEGNNIMIGIRFYPHTAALFIKEEMHLFSNKIWDLTDILGKDTINLFEKLLESKLEERIKLIELFLIAKLEMNSSRRIDKIKMLNSIIYLMQSDQPHHSIDRIAAQCGISSRYVQKIFMECLGISPKMFFKIQRFQHSFKYLNQNPGLLTSVGYACGYFDQSHFIRDFKSFTGIIPSAYRPDSFPINQLFS